MNPNHDDIESLINGNTLSRSVTISHLQQVGALNNLHVNGQIYSNAGRDILSNNNVRVSNTSAGDTLMLGSNVQSGTSAYAKINANEASYVEVLPGQIRMVVDTNSASQDLNSSKVLLNMEEYCDPRVPRNEGVYTSSYNIGAQAIAMNPGGYGSAAGYFTTTNLDVQLEPGTYIARFGLVATGAGANMTVAIRTSSAVIQQNTKWIDGGGTHVFWFNFEITGVVDQNVYFTVYNNHPGNFVAVTATEYLFERTGSRVS